MRLSGFSWALSIPLILMLMGRARMLRADQAITSTLTSLCLSVHIQLQLIHNVIFPLFLV